MKVLVTAASRHGATAEIARRIGETLAATGVEVDIRPPDDVVSVASYDGVVIGSGVYAGHWLQPAKALIERESIELVTRPVWLFSSGPLGEPPKPEGLPADVPALIERTHALDHRVFAGTSDRNQLGIAEKAIVAVVRAPEGDFRPWPEVIAWATGIAETLTSRLMPELVR